MNVDMNDETIERSLAKVVRLPLTSGKLDILTNRPRFGQWAEKAFEAVPVLTGDPEARKEFANAPRPFLARMGVPVPEERDVPLYEGTGFRGVDITLEEAACSPAAAVCVAYIAVGIVNFAVAAYWAAAYVGAAVSVAVYGAPLEGQMNESLSDLEGCV